MMLPILTRMHSRVCGDCPRAAAQKIAEAHFLESLTPVLHKYHNYNSAALMEKDGMW